MKKRVLSLALAFVMLVSLLPIVSLTALAATAPTKLWVAPSDTNGIPAQIDVFKVKSGTTYSYQLYLPGNADLANCYLSWDGDMQATVDGATYDSGACPVPPLETTKTYTFKNGTQTLASFNVITYQGSANVPPVFIDIDESLGTIEAMDSDKENSCSGQVNIGGKWYVMTKMKGRGNATWSESKDKKPYNVTLSEKINFPGIDSAKTKKWTLLAEVLDRSLLCNRAGYHLAHEIGIGQDTASADVWMNGEYQGCYTVTPKTDSFVTKDGFMIEQDNYKDGFMIDNFQGDPVTQGLDPQFALDGLVSHVSGWSSAYNVITIKKLGDNLLGEGGETTENVVAAASSIRSWLQDAWDAIRSDTGYNSKGKYYTDYIDIESFAKMYLMHEYVKSYDVCAGSILFHRDGQTDNDKLIAGPLWDLDNAMGSTYSNNYLGNASDRRSGKGAFISSISNYQNYGSEYKTSIYKTLSKHDDFMAEVKYQYNKHRSAFENLPNDTDQMISEIGTSAKMNHIKVTDLGHNTGKDNHYYSRNTTLENGTEYQQDFLKTTDSSSKTDWASYAANLKTFITARSLWFGNNYYDPSAYVDPATCNHQYETVEVAATCTADGSVTHTCPICRDSYVEVLPKIAHDYQNGECTVCGEHLVTASISCGSGASVTVYETAKPDSAFVENAASANPRNSDTGLIDCGGDGQINFVVNPAPGYEIESVTAEPAGSYKNLKTPADTGITNGYRLTKVSGDLTIIVTAVCQHDYQAVVTAPTCTADGYTTYTCSRCGDTYTADTVEAPGHTPSEAVHENEVPATCSTQGSYDEVVYCSVCHEELSRTPKAIEKTAHTPGDAVRENEVPATCSTQGNYDEVVYCSECHEELSRTPKTIEKTAHTPGDAVRENEVPATCSTEGSYDEVVYCSDCHEELSRTPKAIEKTAHTPGEAVRENEVPATCSTQGSYDEVVYCSECHEELSRTPKTVEKTAHTPGNAVRENEVPATCSKEGSYDEVVYCSECHEEISRTPKTVEKIAHTPGDAVRENEVPATCDKKGSYDNVVRCAVCSGEISRETIMTEPLGHDLIEHGAKVPTCTENGWNAYQTCSRCNYQHYDGLVEALGHQWNVVTKEPTYTAEGVRTYTCSKCKTTKIEKIPTKPMINAPVFSTIRNVSNGVTITWGKVSGAAKYRIYQKVGSGSWAKLADTASVTYTDKTTETGKTYSYRIRCLDSSTVLCSNYSTAKSITFVAPPEISKTANASNGVTVTWSKVAGAAKYRIYRKVASADWTKLADTTSVTYTDKTTATGKTYAYRIRCLNSSSVLCSAYSTSKNITFVAPPVISKTANVSTGVKITWGKVTGAAKYQVYRKLGTGSWTKLGETTAVSYTDKTAVSGKQYSYRVRCVTSGGIVGAFGTAKAQTYAAMPTISGVTNSSSKKMTVKWTKITGVTGYQIQYSTSSTFASGNNQLNVPGISNVSKAIGSLTTGKTYYVRIRTYKKITDTTNVYSAWSAKKAIKISK